MTRADGQKDLHADIPMGLHKELVAWTQAHKKAPLCQCVQASLELWLTLPEPIQALVLICARKSPMFSAVSGEIAKRLKPMADVLGLPAEGPMTPEEFVEGAARRLESTVVKPTGRKAAGGASAK